MVAQSYAYSRNVSYYHHRGKVSEGNLSFEFWILLSWDRGIELFTPFVEFGL